jgi:hypothetical protein
MNTANSSRGGAVKSNYVAGLRALYLDNICFGRRCANPSNESKKQTANYRTAGRQSTKCHVYVTFQEPTDTPREPHFISTWARLMPYLVWPKLLLCSTLRLMAKITGAHSKKRLHIQASSFPFTIFGK